jgi:hypothetical protein
MSVQVAAELGEMSDTGYTIKSMYGCRIVYGPIPMAEFAMLTHGFSKKALVAADIADRLGATIVIGEPEALETLRAMDLPVSQRRETDFYLAEQRGLGNVATWLRTGERGSSSNALCGRIFGVPTDAGKYHPSDPDDLRRCLLFLDATESHDKVPMMADVSPEWRGLVENWGQIVATFREEARVRRSAPRTYALMKEALAAGRRCEVMMDKHLQAGCLGKETL